MAITRMTATGRADMEPHYESMRRSPDVLEAVEDGLLAEQGGICAYTGIQISLKPCDPGSGAAREVHFHIEHLIPQNHCERGQDTDYQNLVACWPRPNCGFEPGYGAKKKGNWPSSEEQARFVSPLRHDCSTRFRFDHQGKIEPANSSDQDAEATIAKLGLRHSELTELRRQAIRGALNPRSRQIKLSEARKLLSQMEHATEALDQGVAIKLRPFCFADRACLAA